MVAMRMLAVALGALLSCAVPLEANHSNHSISVEPAVAPSSSPVPPEQFHIAWSARPADMWITWARPTVPLAAAGVPICRYTPNTSTNTTKTFTAHATTRTYTDAQAGCRSDKAYGGPCVPWSGVIHTALLTDLPPATLVRYSCGTAAGVMGEPRSFTSRPSPAGGTGSVTFGLLGDQGTGMRNINGGMEAYNHTYPGAIFVRDQLLRTPDLSFLHVFGDISYANGNQPVWDGYGRDMDPLLSSVPGLMTPGNHDGEFEFGNSYWRAGEGGGDSGVGYALRFPGPGPELSFGSSHTGAFNSTSLWWSVDAGPVHLVATAGVLGFEPGTAQYKWLEADLAAANTPAARQLRPWIIVTNHYPLYCTLKACNTPARGQRRGRGRRGGLPPPPGVLTINPERMRAALEPLLLKYKVDGTFAGHNHNYERTHAVANLALVSRGQARPGHVGGRVYDRPGAPIHWVVGSGGADPDPTSAWKNKSEVPWLATQLFDDARETTNWGWAKVVANSSCLHVQFMDSYHNNSGLDEVWITK